MARKSLQNLSEPMYYVLLSLRTPLHGYGIMQYIKGLTKDRVAVGAGTLYSLLARFEKEGIIQQLPADNKKVYELTDKGREILDKEIERLKQLIEDSLI